MYARTNHVSTRFALRTIALAAALALAAAAGCASSTQSSSTTTGSSTESSAAGSQPTGVAPPAGSPMAKVQLGMAPGQVTEILGEPGQRKNYMTGKSWIPFYYGSDSTRQEWKYKGQGRVVFSQGSFSGWKVMRVDYDPAEPGY